MTAEEALRKINRLWLEGDVEGLDALVHRDAVMVFPGWGGRSVGREQMLSGFQDFVANARVHEFNDHDYQTDCVGNTAVVSFLYEMVYELAGVLHRARGRDLWVLENAGEMWVAVWRTMLDTREDVAGSAIPH